jgi:dTMP kinase
MREVDPIVIPVPKMPLPQRSKKASMVNKKGKLIVFEGADGSGKTTQSKLLVKYLSGKKVANSYISFPRYEDSMWAQMVKRYLLGEFGSLDRVDPYFGSMLYAGDRLCARDLLCQWLLTGKVVVANRYVPSNLAHMGAKFKSASQMAKYVSWLEKLEYGENKIPKEDKVIFLYVPISVTKNLMDGRELDIHEKSLVYQGKVLTLYQDLAKTRENWIKIDCTDGKKILPPDQIHQKVLKSLGYS